MAVNQTLQLPALPRPRIVLELLKPITWFPPMWAYLCGVVSSGVAVGAHWPLALLGVLVAGPLVCAMSQAANDWCDRHVDAINEPDRPIPSGRLPGRWGLWIALGWTVLSLWAASFLGPWGFGAAVFAVAAAWAYSAEPVRLKRSWIWGPGIVGLCYEGLPWFTGAAVMAAASGGTISWQVVAVAALYALGAHGIMTLNDFKAVEGDAREGVRSMPVVLGPDRAARISCLVIAVPQMGVILLLLLWQLPLYAAAVMVLLALQGLAMRRLLADPRGRAPWYNATGVLLYVLGMMTTAIALSSLREALP
ncbi:MAG: chlorophyll synthase ChlG [Pseudomonadota bacterium]